MYTKKGKRVTVTFRLGKSQLDWLDKYQSYYKQGRGVLLREAVQLWLHEQEHSHPLSQSEVTK